MIEPSVIVLYVENLAVSRTFYNDLLKICPQETSPTFNTFTLTNGMKLGLKAKHTAEPTIEDNGNAELGFLFDDKLKVDNLYIELQTKGIKIAHAPIVMPFGYGFVALDPDNNRLRFVCLN